MQLYNITDRRDWAFVQLFVERRLSYLNENL